MSDGSISQAMIRELDGLRTVSASEIENRFPAERNELFDDPGPSLRYLLAVARGFAALDDLFSAHYSLRDEKQGADKYTDESTEYQIAGDVLASTFESIF
jgi:hypothetical protein